MRIARIGEVGRERPVVLEGVRAYFVDSIINDWSRESLEEEGLEKVRATPLSTLESVEVAGVRVGAPLARPTKLILTLWLARMMR